MPTGRNLNYCEILPMEIVQNASLKPYNTFGIEAAAKYFCEVHTIDELMDVLQSNIAHDENLLILGGGSNVLFKDDYAGLVILNRIGGIQLVNQNNEHVFVKAGGGELWHQLVRWCVERNYGGIENMSFIPGCVGAGPIQNIGAYGAELKDVLHELEAVEVATATLHRFSLADCRLGYRDSLFKREAKGRYVIASVTIRLNKNPVPNTRYASLEKELTRRGITHPTIIDVSDAVIAVRQSKLPEPHVLGNAGSFFKNPEIGKQEFDNLKKKYESIVGFPSANGIIKLSAGWLIEQCGWKGKRVGNTGAHKDQALVLVNYGGATGREVFALALEIRKSVNEKFGVEMELEVNLV